MHCAALGIVSLLQPTAILIRRIQKLIDADIHISVLDVQERIIMVTFLRLLLLLQLCDLSFQSVAGLNKHLLIGHTLKM